MLLRWPKSILSGLAPEILRNACKTGLFERRFARGFRPPPKKTNPCRFVRPCVDARPTNAQAAEPRHATTLRGWTIALEIKEAGSGASVRELRQKLLDAARRRDIDVIVVWRLDRWGRSIADFVTPSRASICSFERQTTAETLPCRKDSCPSVLQLARSCSEPVLRVCRGIMLSDFFGRRRSRSFASDGVLARLCVESVHLSSHIREL